MITCIICHSCLKQTNNNPDAAPEMPIARGIMSGLEMTPRVFLGALYKGYLEGFVLCSFETLLDFELSIF